MTDRRNGAGGVGGSGEPGDYYYLSFSIGQAKWLLSALPAGFARCCYYCHAR